MVLIGLVFVSLGSYCYYALKEFKKDKAAYIFDVVSNNSKRMIEEFRDVFNSILKDAYLVGGLYNKNADNKVLCLDLFKKDPNAIELKILKEPTRDDMQASDPSLANQPDKIDGEKKISAKIIGGMEETLHLINDNWFIQNQLEQSFLETLSTEDSKLDFELIKKSLVQIINVSTGEQMILTFAIYNPNENEYYLYRYSFNEFVSQFNKSVEVKNTLLDYRGSVLAHFDKTAVLQKKSFSQDSFYRQVLDHQATLLTTEMPNVEGKKALVSFYKDKAVEVMAISEIPISVAYAALDDLIKKSVVFAILLSVIAFTLAVFLAQSFSRPIHELMQATVKIAGGDFKSKIHVKSKDELGVLADGFNFMSGEIMRYMSEVQEKARMQNELAVAQLVQSAFFPERNATINQLKVAGYYTPASECGGDWWGYVALENKLLVFIGDATGHGVPAALITATANCCINLLENMAETDSRVLEGPEYILKLLNKVVCSVGGQILMTFFVAIIDQKTLEIKYANASHNPPFHYRKAQHSPTKDDVDILLSESGPRLGHKKDAVYQAGKSQLSPGDAILFCSDGIIEGQNPEKKMYGERRMLKTFIANVTKSPQEVIDSLLIDANDFYEGVPVDDDLTLVTVRVDEEHT
jgi:sigma-B regulation protein RsbU (phosphoserine phosphatase)